MLKLTCCLDFKQRNICWCLVRDRNKPEIVPKLDRNPLNMAAVCLMYWTQEWHFQLFWYFGVQPGDGFGKPNAQMLQSRVGSIDASPSLPAAGSTVSIPGSNLSPFPLNGLRFQPGTISSLLKTDPRRHPVSINQTDRDVLSSLLPVSVTFPAPVDLDTLRLHLRQDKAVDKHSVNSLYSVL